MQTYIVKYEIDIDAESPKSAALEVEKILKDMYFRPSFIVKDSHGIETYIDLEKKK
jgi:disulfide oxidoreductase YuzD